MHLAIHYKRLCNKAVVIKDISDPLVDPNYLLCRCDLCDRLMTRRDEWRFSSSAGFKTVFGCSDCGIYKRYSFFTALRMASSKRVPPDLIILDPPRDGIHPKALPKIISYGVDKMVYVSCKPTSLARDLEVFMANGYKPTRLCLVDMFPGTVHVETVCLLSKKA